MNLNKGKFDMSSPSSSLSSLEPDTGALLWSEIGWIAYLLLIVFHCSLLFLRKLLGNT